MKNRCGSCKFWGTKIKFSEKKEDSQYRTCTAMTHDKNYEITDSHWEYEPLEERDSFKELTKEQQTELIDIRALTKAAVVDGSGYYAALKCKEDFGCVLWEQK